MMRVVRLAALAGVVSALGVALAAQTAQRALTIDAIYHPEQRVNFSGSPAPNLTWVDDTTYLVARRAERGFEWNRINAESGVRSALFDAARMDAALAAIPGVSGDQASRAARSNALILNPARTGVLATIADDLYFYDFAGTKASRLTHTPGSEEEATFSPDGRAVAFVRGNNLHAVDIASQKERALTTDGGAAILNGKLDWLYQEEIWGRGWFRAYWWSPDSTRLAFLRLDEKPVPEYTVVDDIPYRPTVEVTDYPKAGDPNPTVKLGIVKADGGKPEWVDLSAYAAIDFLIVKVEWTPDAQQVMHQVQDREQTWLDLNFAERSSGRSRTALRETSKAWVNFAADTNPVWLKDGSFLWSSERSGFNHIYHYRRDGTLLRPVTAGRWDVRTFYGVDEKNGLIYFSSGAARHVDTDIYRTGIDGTGMTRVSRTGGTHQPRFNPSFTMYVDVWSDIITPAQTRLHRIDGSEVRVIEANPVPALAEYRTSTPELLEVKARDGFVMDAILIKPPDFDPSRRYPVYQFTYAGPASSSVRNQWGGTQYMFHQLLAQHGVLVWILDNRSAGGKGIESQWPVYGRLGELELQDLEDGVRWLRQQPYVDPSRILLSGWSYGGFMTTYAMTHSTSWAAGIAGGPVTDWRNYDTVYTERYMKTPQNNAEGYRKTAPRFAAGGLKGRLLLIHGAIDDNVHMQNTLQMTYELQRAGKPFELMIYPKSRHGVTEPQLVAHLRQSMFDFVMRTVGAGSSAGP